MLFKPNATAQINTLSVKILSIKAPMLLLWGLFFFTSCQADQESAKRQNLSKPQFAKHFAFSAQKDSLFILDSNEEIIQIFSKTETYQNIYCLATPAAVAIRILEDSEKIKGIAFAEYVRDSLLSSKINEGEITSLKLTGSIDYEWILRSQDILILHNTLELAGEDFNNTLLSLEYLEPTPLGRAEWIVVFGWLLGKEKSAQAFFEQVVLQYEDLKETIGSADKKNNAFSGSYFGQTWYVAEAESYMSNLIKDLNLDLTFNALNGKKSSPVDLEVLLQKPNAKTYFISIIERADNNLTAHENLGLSEKESPLFVTSGQTILLDNSTHDFYGRWVFEPHKLLYLLHQALETEPKKMKAIIP